MKNFPLVGWRDEFGTNIHYWWKDIDFEDVKVSDILRLFNLKNINDTELENRISIEMWIDLNKQESIDHINSIYEKSISMYIDIFLIDIKTPFITKRWNHFKNKGDFITFLRKNHSTTKKDIRQVYCDLTKIMFCFNEIKRYPQMTNAEKYAKELISDNVINNVNNIKSWEFVFDLSQFMEKKQWKEYFEWEWTYKKRMPWWWFKSINCKLRFRWKSEEKIIVKILWSERWFWDIWEIIKDSVGLELESTDKIENWIYLLEYEYFLYKELWIISEFRQKPWFYSQWDLSQFIKDETLCSEFRDFLRNLEIIKKKNGTYKYKDCKFQWSLFSRDGKEFWFESRYVEKWNKNQSWMSNSAIVDGKKLRDAIIWLRWWVSESYLKRIVNNIINDPDILKEGNYILEDFLSWLVKVNVPWLNRNIYSSNWRLSEIIANAHKYPEFIVNAIKKFYKIKDYSQVISHVKKTVWDQITISSKN